MAWIDKAIRSPNGQELLKYFFENRMARKAEDF
jgi:hypothetical protein